VLSISGAARRTPFLSSGASSPARNQGRPALYVLRIGILHPRRDECSNAASGPDEVLELAHVVTTKTPKQTLPGWEVSGTRYFAVAETRCSAA